MKAKKSLGQNFLMHQAIAERIAEAAHLSLDDTVLEIGPGTGKLTRALLSRAGKVVAIEADAELIPFLQETFADELKIRKLELVHGDIREFDTLCLPNGYKLVANIPYYLTGEIIRRFLSAAHRPASMTLLVQKEVAERIARAKKESLLSLSVKAYGSPRYEFIVPRGAFLPAPKVDSAVLSLTSIRPDAFSSPEEESRFFEVLKAGFAHKRKLLSGNLGTVFGKEKVQKAFETLQLDEKIRSEDLPLSVWRELAKLLAP